MADGLFAGFVVADYYCSVVADLHLAAVDFGCNLVDVDFDCSAGDSDFVGSNSSGSWESQRSVGGTTRSSDLAAESRLVAD